MLIKLKKAYQLVASFSFPARLIWNIHNENISSKKPLRVLRFMSGNPELKKEDIEQLVYYIEGMIKEYE